MQEQAHGTHDSTAARILVSTVEYEAFKDMHVKSVSICAETPVVKATGGWVGGCACACACASLRVCVVCVSTPQDTCGVCGRACVRACVCVDVDVREES
jgi:hypothetical protein